MFFLAPVYDYAGSRTGRLRVVVVVVLYRYHHYSGTPLSFRTLALVVMIGDHEWTSLTQIGDDHRDVHVEEKINGFER